MKTDELIALLGARDSAPAARTWPVAAVLGAAVIASVLLMLATLGTLPHLRQAVLWPAFWGKLAFVLAMSVLACRAALRLARPGARTAGLPFLVAAPVLVLWLAAAWMLLQAAPDARAALLLGRTWRTCPLLITMLSAPLLPAALWAMRTMAPTRLRLAGAAAGLAAGAVAALVYSVHCPEMSPGFIGLWYLLGMLAPTALGAALAPRLLAW